MKIERTKNTIRNIVWGYAYKLFAIILPFILRTVMLRELGAEYLGINSLFLAVVQVLNLSELGLGIAIVYSMYKPIAENDTAHLRALLLYFKKVYRSIGVVVLGVGVVVIPFLPYLVKDGAPQGVNLIAVYLLFLLNSVISYLLFAYQGALMSAFQRNDVESKILLFVAIVRYLSEIVVVVMLHNYYLFLIIDLFSTIIVNLLKHYVTKKMYPDISPQGDISNEEKKDIATNAVALMCHKVGWIMLNSVDNIVISVFLGSVWVANYNNYYYIISAIEGIIIIAFAGMTAGVGNIVITESTAKIRENFRRMLFFNAWIICFCCSCLTSIYQDFIRLWVGEKYMLDNTTMLLLVFYFYVHNIRRTVITYRDALGVWAENKFQPILSASLNLGLNIFLVQIYGIYGIVISSIISMAIIDIPWETSVLCKKLGFSGRDYMKEMVKFLSFFIISVLASYVMSVTVDGGNIVNIIFKLAIGIFSINILWWLCFKKREEFYYFINLIKQNFVK